jgi:hypothetical protein
MEALMTTDKTYESKVVRLTELAGDEAVLRDFVFIDCDVRGPAVILLRGSTLANSMLGGPADSVLWEIPAERMQVVGAILVENCTFEQCRFSGVGFAGPPDAIAQMRTEVAS